MLIPDSAVIVGDREDFWKKQLEDNDVYEKDQNDTNILINTIMRALEKVVIRGDLSNDTLPLTLLPGQRS